LTCSATSDGGTANQSVTIKRDSTLPTATASRLPLPNTDGWNESNVTVHFSGSDATSVVASCTADEVLSAEGANQSSGSGTCTDNAGKVSASTSISGINIDKTAPSVSASVAPASWLVGTASGLQFADPPCPFGARCGMSSVAMSVNR
jgi:hypothetical protein